MRRQFWLLRCWLLTCCTVVSGQISWSWWILILDFAVCLTCHEYRIPQVREDNMVPPKTEQSAVNYVSEIS